eukprot:6212526-Pleurochrysis_carterae.AAC.2
MVGAVNSSEACPLGGDAIARARADESACLRAQCHMAQRSLPTDVRSVAGLNLVMGRLPRSAVAVGRITPSSKLATQSTSA